MYLRKCSVEAGLREREESFSHHDPHLNAGGAVVGWNVDFQDDLESSALCSVHEFTFLIRLRLNQWIILKMSEMHTYAF